MKIVAALLSLFLAAALCFATSLSAKTQQAPAQWGPGCNKALLDGEFSLSNAPAMPCSEYQKEYINNVIDEISGKKNFGSAIVLEKSPHPYMDTPEFIAFYLRAFAEPGESLQDYSYRFDRLMARVSQHMPMLADARLDWDIWRAWLLFENTANTSNSFESRRKYAGNQPEHKGKIFTAMETLTSARELLWNYLTCNAEAILKDPKRRAWWITRLADNLEAEGGRPQRRWFLLALLRAADPKCEALMKIPMPEKFLEVPDDAHKGRRFPLRLPHPLDPFLIVRVGIRDNKAPSLSDIRKKIALDNILSRADAGNAPVTQSAITTNANDKDSLFSGDMEKITVDNKLLLTISGENPLAPQATALGKNEKTPLFSGTLAINAPLNKPLPGAAGIHIGTRPIITIISGTYDKIPSFSDAVADMASNNELSLTVLDIDPAAQPETAVKTVRLEMTKWPTDESEIINQESWSIPGSPGYEWGVRFYRPVGRREAYSSVSFPKDRTDGVFFFVFNQRLYVWPKAKMDAAVIHMLRVANLIDTATAADFERRGFAPLKETLVKERPEK